jgi:hypothetical protein
MSINCIDSDALLTAGSFLPWRAVSTGSPAGRILKAENKAQSIELRAHRRQLVSWLLIQSFRTSP